MQKNNFILQRSMAALLSIALVLSLCILPVNAAWSKEDLNPTQNSAEIYGKTYDVQTVISLSEDQTHLTVTIPTNLSVSTLNAKINEGLVFSMVRNANRPYLDPNLYPNQSQGGTFETWKAQNGSAMYQNVTARAIANGSKAQLVVSFDANCYFYDRNNNVDYSAPHANGGAYLDICGYFTVVAKTAGGAQLGTGEVKVAPYENFHTMDELYVAMKDLVKKGNENGLYMTYESMGSSTAGRDMPYMIVADSKASVDAWLQLTELAETNPQQVLSDINAGRYNDVRVPVVYSNIHSNEVSAVDGVLNFAKMLADAGKNGTLSYNNLTGFTAEGQAQLAAEKASRKVVVPDLVKDTATYLGFLQDGNGKSAVVDMDKYYTQETVSVKVEDLLKDVFFILVPEENVDGRTYVTRQSSNGYDLNRDNSFQTTSETMNMQQLIGTYNPVSLTEFHGRVTAFQCEPCDPPHEPNFEYDLLAQHLVTGGEAFGIAAVANNDKHNSYVIPQRDYLVEVDGTPFWDDAWDDMSTSYTPQFAMLHGCVAYTVEQPAYDDAMVKALQYGMLGQANYIAKEKLGYLKAQVEIFKRGVTNANSDAYALVGQWLANQWDVEGAESALFRPEYKAAGENGNFYPECYIIPLDRTHQKNLQAAADMMVWLARNDVKVNVTTAEFTDKGETYPAGTMVISMYQAKRSVANGALYKGTLIQNWTTLYSEGITSFNETRGFDMVTVAEPASYSVIKNVLGQAMDYDAAQAYALANVKTSFTGIAGFDVIIKNVSEDSTAAVNALLQAGKTVAMITEGEYKGDFICSYASFQTVRNAYRLTATGVSAASSNITAYILSNPVVYLTGVPTSKAASGFAYNTQVSGANNWNYDRFAMEQMNFKTTENAAEATVVAGASALSGDALTAVQSGKPYIGYGSTGANNDSTKNLVSGVTRTGLSGAMDLKAYVTYPQENMINTTFVSEGDDVMYGYGYGYFSAVPEGAEVLVKVDKSKTPTEGFVPTNTQARLAAYNTFMDNGILGFSYKDENINIALFANSLTNKGHQRDEYAFISNFIFANSMTDTLYKSGNFVDVVKGSYYEDAVSWAVANSITTGLDDAHFGPSAGCSRAQVVTFLWRLAGCPEADSASFPDVAKGSYYEKAASWAAAQGITTGMPNGNFEPNTICSRAQIVTFLYRYSQAQKSGSANKFKDVVDSAFYYDAVLWASENNITTGITETSFCPAETCQRAQVVTFLYRFANL